MPDIQSQSDYQCDGASTFKFTRMNLAGLAVSNEYGIMHSMCRAAPIF
jgi:hypothetical protein